MKNETNNATTVLIVALAIAGVVAACTLDVDDAVDSGLPPESERRRAYEKVRSMAARGVKVAQGRGVTMDAYTQLTDGMSYDRAVEIIGKDGTEISRSGSLVMYRWDNPYGGRMTAMFRNRRLTSKAQLGLQ